MAQNGVVIILEVIALAVIAYCKREAYFDGQKGYRLANSEIKNLVVYTPLDCALKCTRDSLCKSLNYKQSNSDANLCYLNNRTRRSASNDDFKSDPKFTYYEKDPCYSSPCMFGSCARNNGKEGFQCTCTPGYKGSLCDTERLGWSPLKPAKSCNKIKLAGDALHDGKYWVDPDNSGNAMQVYCDMSHEGGGWLLVSNVVLPNPANVPTLTLRTSYRDIANYNDNKTILSPAALSQIRQYTNFTQLRFHCRLASVVRTLHIITKSDAKGYAVVDYFTATTNVQPQACDSFDRGSDDSSYLAVTCAKWKNSKWGSPSRVNDWRLNDHTFYVPLKYHWTIKSIVACDSQGAINNPGDFWKIYVR